MNETKLILALLTTDEIIDLAQRARDMLAENSDIGFKDIVNACEKELAFNDTEYNQNKIN